MANEHGDQPRRPIDPLVGVVTDSVALGYEALELVVVGLRESLRLKSSGGAGSSAGPGGPARAPARQRSPAAGRGREGARASSGALVSDLAGIAAELLGRAGAVAAEVASSASARSPERAQTATIPELLVQGPSGQTLTLEFAVWSTGHGALRAVKLDATDLIGPNRLPAQGTVTFKPAVVPRIGPGQSVAVKVEVEVPESATAGTYRGLVQAEPGDTCSVLTVIVTDPASPEAGS
jgi:hypothetical protein